LKARENFGSIVNAESVNYVFLSYKWEMSVKKFVIDERCYVLEVCRKCGKIMVINSEFTH